MLEHNPNSLDSHPQVRFQAYCLSMFTLNNPLIPCDFMGPFKFLKNACYHDLLSLGTQLE